MKIKKSEARKNKAPMSQNGIPVKKDEELDNVEVVNNNLFGCDSLSLTIIILKIVLWCMLLTLFVLLEFGTVFVILSLFYFIFTNFRDTKKEPGEPSAYSVFNPNCEAIEGTLTAQQFERELLMGPAALR